MPVVKTIVCLANSRKLSGRCVAGLELSNGRRVGWIRPVSAREHEEVSEHERQYEDGSDPRVLDLMSVPLVHPHPKGLPTGELAARSRILLEEDGSDGLERPSKPD